MSTIAPLQGVQNAAARLVFQLGTREHVTASLLQLHWLPVQSNIVVDYYYYYYYYYYWLPVRWRVQFKLCCLMHSIFHGGVRTT